MPRRNNNTNLLLIVILVIVALGVFCAWNKSFKAKENESYEVSSKVGGGGSGKHDKPDMELIPQSDGDSGAMPSGDMVQPLPGEPDFQLLGVADAQPAFELGFGMGPGLYGSGRHTSVMLGN